MIYYALKIPITTVFIVPISKVFKRNSFIGAAVGFTPFILVLAIFWLYIDAGEAAKVSDLPPGIFGLVLSFLVLFLTLPVSLKLELYFYWDHIKINQDHHFVLATNASSLKLSCGKVINNA